MNNWILNHIQSFIYASDNS
jgi:hypothetical protein